MSEVAVVTGAARGIGLATTRRFVDQGMKVAMVDRDADVLLEEAKQFGDSVLPIVCDVSIPEQVDAMAFADQADMIARYGGSEAALKLGAPAATPPPLPGPEPSPDCSAPCR